LVAPALFERSYVAALWMGVAVITIADL